MREVMLSLLKIHGQLTNGPLQLTDDEKSIRKTYTALFADSNSASKSIWK